MFGGSGLGNKFGSLDILSKFGGKFGGLGGLGNKFGGLGNKFGSAGDKYGGVNYGDSEYGRPGYYGSPGGYGDGHEIGAQESGFGDGSIPAPNHLATQQVDLQDVEEINLENLEDEDLISIENEEFEHPENEHFINKRNKNSDWPITFHFNKIKSNLKLILCKE